MPPKLAGEAGEVQTDQEQKPKTLLENLEETKDKMQAKLTLIKVAEDMVRDNPIITEYNNVMMELQKIRV